MNDIGFREQIAQEAETRHLHGKAEWFRRHLKDLDFQDVTGFGAVDINGTGQGMHQVQVGGGYLFRCGCRIVLPVKGIPRFHANDLARVDLRNRFDIRVPAVVSRFRFIAQLQASIDTDVFVSFNSHERTSFKSVKVLFHWVRPGRERLFSLPAPGV